MKTLPSSYNVFFRRVPDQRSYNEIIASPFPRTMSLKSEITVVTSADGAHTVNRNMAVRCILVTTGSFGGGNLWRSLRSSGWK